MNFEGGATMIPNVDYTISGLVVSFLGDYQASIAAGDILYIRYLA